MKIELCSEMGKRLLSLLSMKQCILLAVLFSCLCHPVLAGKPKWVNNTPKELNDTYRFIEIVSYGRDLNAAKMNARQLLQEDEQLRHAVTISVNQENLTKIDQTVVNGGVNENVAHNFVITTNIKGKEFRLQATPVDEYVEYSDGAVTLYTLFMVGVADRVVFDRVYKTTNYGAAPAVMSIIPGVGQFYKGSYLKGAILLGSVAACGISALFCESERSDYKNKMQEQPQFAVEYNNKAKNYETARNICLGVGAAIWLYNIIDAAAAKGSKKLIIKPENGTYLSLHPIATPTSAGISLTYNF